MLTQSHTNIKKLGSIANLLHCTVWSIHDHPRLFHRKSDEHTSPNRDMQMFQLCSTHALKGFKNKSPVPRRVEAGPESACGQGSSRSQYLCKELLSSHRCWTGHPITLGLATPGKRLAGSTSNRWPSGVLSSPFGKILATQLSCSHTFC